MELIPITTDAFTSVDFTLLDRQQGTLSIKDNISDTYMRNGNKIDLQIKSTDGQYLNVGTLDHIFPIARLNSPGTYRVVKSQSSYAYGADFLI